MAKKIKLILILIGFGFLNLNTLAAQEAQLEHSDLAFAKKSIMHAVLSNSPGCPVDDGAGYIRCLGCWSAQACQMPQARCAGDCATICGPCYSIYEVPGETYHRIEVYFGDGTIKASYNILNDWQVNNITINGFPAIEVLFTTI